MDDAISNIRRSILSANGCEAKALLDSPGLKILFDSKQQLLKEMNEAKRTAVAEATKPYLEKIAEIDIEYAVMLQMVGDNGTNS